MVQLETDVAGRMDERGQVMMVDVRPTIRVGAVAPFPMLVPQALRIGHEEIDIVERATDDVRIQLGDLEAFHQDHGAGRARRHLGEHRLGNEDGPGVLAPPLCVGLGTEEVEAVLAPLFGRPRRDRALQALEQLVDRRAAHGAARPPSCRTVAAMSSAAASWMRSWCLTTSSSTWPIAFSSGTRLMPEHGAGEGEVPCRRVQAGVPVAEQDRRDRHPPTRDSVVDRLVDQHRFQREGIDGGNGRRQHDAAALRHPPVVTSEIVEHGRFGEDGPAVDQDRAEAQRQMGRRDRRLECQQVVRGSGSDVAP